MTEREYEALCARIARADALPAAVREAHGAAYEALCARALDFEFANGRFPLRWVVDGNVRMVVEALLRDHAALLAAGSAQEYRAQALRVLADCMALVAEDADKALAAFGCRED